MLRDSFQAAGYFYLLDIISSYAVSSLGRDYCLSLRPINDPDEINDRLSVLSELRELLRVKGWAFNEDIGSVDVWLDKADTEDSCLNCDEILLIKRLLEAALNIKKFISSEGKEYKRIYALVQQIPNLKPLLALLDRSISDTGKIKDSASIRLRRIREKKAYYRNYVQEKLTGLLESLGIGDFHISIRDGRYVVGLSSGKRGSIKGIFHGYSHSKATSFIEPAEVVAENNHIAELEGEEKEEEIRILRTITKEIAKEKGQIKRAQFLLSKIDGLYAQARFCNLLSCVSPEICEEDVIEINGARNPLLAYLSLKGEGECIPVDLKLSGDKNVLIISGPNKGGKTVALKTLGLMCFMTQTGLHIPAREGSRLRIFRKISVEIGDDQDIRSGMSTFSAHVQHLKGIVENADQDTLVIIDEPGMGTDPLEGASLSMAILDYLIEKNVFVAISTHLNRIKLYGINNKRVMNASVEFDPEKGLPTYRLRYGGAGISMGFEIARNMGMPEDILIKAKTYLDDNEFRLNRSIARLNELICHLDDEKRELEEIRRKHEYLYKKIAEEKERIIESARIEAESLIKDAREKLRKTIQRLKKDRDVSPKQIVNKVSDIAKELMTRFEPLVNTHSVTSGVRLKKGQAVYHKGLKRGGIVLSYNPKKENVFILLGNIRLWSNLKDIEVMEEELKLHRKEDQVRLEMNDNSESDFMPEINLIGYRVDEAIPVIDRAIDRAILNGNPGFRIIHGIGTGRLRKALREYLKAIPQVKDVKKADSKFGGDAITIVELR